MSAAARGAAGYRYFHRNRKRKPSKVAEDALLAFERRLVERFGLSPERAHEYAVEQAGKRFAKEAAS